MNETTAENGVLLRVKGVKKTYRTGQTELKVLRGIDLEIERGEMVGIVGESGSGKSTLLHIMGLLDQPDVGSLEYRGADLCRQNEAAKALYRNSRVGFIFQFYHLLPELTAMENVVLPEMMRKTPGEFRAAQREIQDRGEELLEAVGLKGRARHRPGELSGGEKQRVAVARALMNQPELVLCDEPTGNLDSRTSGEVVDLILDLNSRMQQTFVIVTHEMSLARKAERVYRIDEGLLAPAELPEWVE